MMDIDQYHRELRDTFNHDYRLMLISNYMRLMGESWEAAESAVDNVLMMHCGGNSSDNDMSSITMANRYKPA